MRDGVEILSALDEAAKGVQAASTELSQLIAKFGEGYIDANGELHEGTKLRFEVAAKEAITRLYEQAIANGKRPPGEDIRSAMAELEIRKLDPQLWAEYHGQKNRIEALKLWLSNQRQVISGYQSLRRAET